MYLPFHFSYCFYISGCSVLVAFCFSFIFYCTTTAEEILLYPSKIIKMSILKFYTLTSKKNYIFAALKRTNKRQSIMPQISYFYGIYIFMNFYDHNPAHFHAWYGDYKVSIEIANGNILGKMPRRALNLIFE